MVGSSCNVTTWNDPTMCEAMTPWYLLAHAEPFGGATTRVVLIRPTSALPRVGQTRLEQCGPYQMKSYCDLCCAILRNSEPVVHVVIVRVKDRHLLDVVSLRQGLMRTSTLIPVRNNWGSDFISVGMELMHFAVHVVRCVQIQYLWWCIVLLSCIVTFCLQP